MQHYIQAIGAIFVIGAFLTCTGYALAGIYTGNKAGSINRAIELTLLLAIACTGLCALAGLADHIQPV